MNRLGTHSPLLNWSSRFFVHRRPDVSGCRATPSVHSGDSSRRAEFVGGHNLPKSRKSPHKTSFNTQSAGHRKFARSTRSAYIYSAGVPSRGSPLSRARARARGAEERTSVFLGLPPVGAPIQWLLRLTPSEPTAVEIDFRVSRIFRQPRLIVRDARGSGILFYRISPTGHTDAPTQSTRIRHEDPQPARKGE